MIVCFEGTPGSGKSYEAVKKIIDNLKLGRIVYTNIDGLDDRLCREHIKSLSGLTDYELETRLLYLPNWQALEFYKHITEKSLVVLDEVHKLYSNRNWSDDVNKNFSSWSSTHRKSGNDVILVTQNLEKVDAHVRSLVEWTYRFKKLNMLGRFFRNGYKRSSYTEDDTSGKSIDTKFYKYDARIFPCYKSYISDDIKELNIMEHTNLLKHPVFFVIPIFLALAIYMIFFKSSFASGDLFGSKKVLARADSIQKQAVPADASKSPDPVPVVPDVSKGGVELHIPSSGKLTEKVDCDFVGHIEAGNDLYTYFRCGDYTKVYKNNVIEAKIRLSLEGGIK